ncbi:hypothetical protein [Candidatus Vallotia cooleyia]|uniref:hypothetical protein n=1 Tax=Candidatus Vallotiella adelgis TaxID=1177211 RepID=UPI001D005753|nr:hypothetical protein [Candidatus Vallotia cooleyia]
MIDIFSAKQEKDWNCMPIQSFEAWLAMQPGRNPGRPLRASTAKVYLAQWRSFIRYIEAHQIFLNTVTPNTINAFLSSLDYENRDQRARYRKLIERVFIAIRACTQQQQVNINPAVAALCDRHATWNKIHGNRDTIFFYHRTDIELLISY